MTDMMMLRRRLWRVPLLLALLFLAAGCVNHSVGPARTADDFERKARTTAEESLSAVETVRLVAEIAGRGDAFGPYTGVTVSEQEDTIDEIQSDFNSIQPPDDAADELRRQLDEIISSSIQHIADVRIAVRRGQLDQLESISRPLVGDAAALQAFLDSIA